MRTIQYFLLTLLLAAFVITGCTDYSKTIYGTWKFNKDKSTDLATWRYRQPQLVIRNEGGSGISIVTNWLERNKTIMVDSVNFIPGGEPVAIPITSQYWYENWYMGVLAKVGTMKIISGNWEKQDRSLKFQKELAVETSQGDTQIQTTYSYNLNRKRDILTVVEKRASRPTPIELVFDRVEADEPE